MERHKNGEYFWRKSAFSRTPGHLIFGHPANKIGERLFAADLADFFVCPCQQFQLVEERTVSIVRTLSVVPVLNRALCKRMLCTNVLKTLEGFIDDHYLVRKSQRRFPAVLLKRTKPGTATAAPFITAAQAV